MSFLKDWYDVSKAVIRSPSRFYQAWELLGGYSYGLKFLAFNSVLSGFMLGLLSFALNISSLGQAFKGLAGGLILSAVIMFFYLVNISLAHLLMKVLGAEKGLDTTLEVMSYPSALGILSWVPLLNFLLGIYYLYICVVGLKKFQNISGTRIAASIIVANLFGWLVALLLIGLAVVALGGIFGGLLSLTGF